MTQKVFIVNVFGKVESENDLLAEIDPPGLNKLLEEGYVIQKVHQNSPETTYVTTITFILHK